MPSTQDQFDEAMYHFSMAQYDRAEALLRRLLEEDPNHFDARLALGMALYRQGNYTAAIAEGHRAEALRPQEQLVHTNLSLFYMRAGEKQKAEHHGLQARIASWREGADSGTPSTSDAGLNMAQTPAAPQKFTGRLPDMPWKKAAASSPSAPRPDPARESPPEDTGGETA